MVKADKPGSIKASITPVVSEESELKIKELALQLEGAKLRCTHEHQNLKERIRARASI